MVTEIRCRQYCQLFEFSSLWFGFRFHNQGFCGRCKSFLHRFQVASYFTFFHVVAMLPEFRNKPHTLMLTDPDYEIIMATMFSIVLRSCKLFFKSILASHWFCFFLSFS